MTQHQPTRSRRSVHYSPFRFISIQCGLAIVLCLLAGRPALGEGKTPLLIEKITATPSLEKKFSDLGMTNRLARCLESLETQLTHVLGGVPEIRLPSEVEIRKLQGDTKTGEVANLFDLSDPATRNRLNKAGIKHVLRLRVMAFEEESESKAQTQVRTMTYAHRQAEARVHALEQQLTVTKGPRRRQIVQHQLAEARGVLEMHGTNSVYNQDKRSVIERRVALLANAQLLDTVKGEILSAASYEMKTNSLDTTVTANADKQDAREDLSRSAANWLASKLAIFAVDAIDPMKVLKVEKDIVTINRGDHSGLVSGQMFTVYTEGELLKDPTTGQVKGHEEHVVGRVRVLEIGSKLSKARIVDEKGIAVGALLRRIER